VALVPSFMPPMLGTMTGVTVTLPQPMTWKVALKMPCSAPAVSLLEPST
jgi:hypothetical protein